MKRRIINTEKEEVKEENELDQGVARVQTIKFAVTALVLIIIVGLTIKFWNPAKTYVVHFEGDKNEGYEWTYELEKEGVVDILNEYYASGVFTFEFEPKEEGKTKIFFICTKDGKEMPGEVHTIEVNEELQVQASIEEE